MKKIKLFAFAVLAMLSTNAFAQSATDAADDTWQYYTVMDGDGEYTLANIIGLVDSKKGTIENLEIPEQVTGTGGFKYTVTGIDVNGGVGAFKDDAKIKTVTIPANIEFIGEDAFYNCYNLTTVTFASGSKLAEIQSGAFAETSSLEKLDLSNTKVFDFGVFTPFVKAPNLNVSLEEIVLAAKTYEIGTALAGLTALKKTNIASTRIQILHAGAFTGDKKLTSVELPAVYFFDPVTGEKDETPQNTTLENDALLGSFIQTLTINGAIGVNGVGVLGATGTVGAPTLTTVNFKGVVGTDGADIAIVAGAFDGNYTLTTATFAEVRAGAIGSASFAEAALDPSDPTKLKGKLTFTVAKANDAAAIFEDEAVFYAAPLGNVADNNVEVKAPTAAATGVTPLNRANFTASDPAAIIVEKVTVYGTTTCYGKFINRSGASVAINRDDAVVYSTYVDGSKAYMDPLQIVKGQQIIDDGEAVVIKAVKPQKAEDGSQFIPLAAPAAGAPAHTMRINAGGDLVNDIAYLDVADGVTPGTDEYISAATLKAYQPDDVLYVLGDLSKGVNWQTPKDAVRLYDNTIYIFAAAAPAGGRLEVIWLDDSEEEATAIKSVKTAAEKGAIYNLAGQKVDASYKGIVIKDGKKYIQK